MAEKQALLKLLLYPESGFTASAAALEAALPLKGNSPALHLHFKTSTQAAAEPQMQLQEETTHHSCAGACGPQWERILTISW